MNEVLFSDGLKPILRLHRAGRDLVLRRDMKLLLSLLLVVVVMLRLLVLLKVLNLVMLLRSQGLLILCWRELVQLKLAGRDVLLLLLDELLIILLLEMLLRWRLERGILV